MTRMTIGLIIAATILGSSPFFAQPDPPVGSYYFVDPSGSDSNTGMAPDDPFQTIQHALNLAEAGDTIHLAPSTFIEDIVTVRDGKAGAPITILGTSESILIGKSNGRILQILHSYIELHGFTVDGRKQGGNGDDTNSYWSKLVYIVGQESGQVTEGIRIINMNFKNAGEECLRMRYFIQYSDIAYSTFENCGIYDFRFNNDGKVGEAIYVGTSSTQWNKNPSDEPDMTAYNWIHHNHFETFGNECIDMKEGTRYNIIEYNICSNQQDTASAGISSRGDENIIRFNEIYQNLGAGVRLGGHSVNEVQYGMNNHVYGNIIYQNGQGGIKVETEPQGMVCGNTVFDNAFGATTGDFRTAIDLMLPCEPQVIQDHLWPPVRG